MSESGDLSRRDFLKLLKIGASTLVAERAGIFRLAESGLYDLTTDRMRSIVQNIEKPPDWLDVNLPEINEHYMGPEEIVKSAKGIYKYWYDSGLVGTELYSSKSPVYVGVEDLPADVVKVALGIHKDTLEILTSDLPAEEKKYHLYSMRRNLIDSFQIEMQELLEAKEIIGCSPFSFAYDDIYDFQHLIDHDPGCGILSRSANRKGGLRLANFKAEVQQVWNWVDEYNTQNNKPMGIDVFVAGLCAINSGDLRKSCLDATILAKLIRNDPESLDRYNDALSPGGSQRELFKSSLLKMSSRLQDQFALCTSSNWVMKEVGFDERVFCLLDDDNGFKTKFLDINTAIGHIYHGLNLLVLPTCVDPILMPALLIGEFDDFYNSHGVEKFFSDLNVVLRAPRLSREF